MTDQPLDHIIRPQLPWQSAAAAMTECGRRTNDVGATIDTDEFVARVKRLGQQRVAMTTCMTCFGRAKIGYQLNETWESNPGAILGRAIERQRYAKDGQLNRELHAMAMLAEAHRAEFDDLVAGLEQTVSLADRRRKRG